jgi:hypothetical protein
VAVAFPNDSEEVKDLLKGKTTELQDKATEALSWAQVRRCPVTFKLCATPIHSTTTGISTRLNPSQLLPLCPS